MYCMWLGRDHDHSTETSHSLNSTVNHHSNTVL